MSPTNPGAGANPSASDTLKRNLGDTGSHLRQAAHDSSDAARNAGRAASDELNIGKANVKADLADSALSGIAAAESLSEASREQVDALMEKSQDLIESASDLIRERPLASFGAAFAAGWLISRLARR